MSLWHFCILLPALAIIMPGAAYGQYVGPHVSVEIENLESTVYIRDNMPELLFSANSAIFVTPPEFADVWARVVQASTGKAVHAQPLIINSFPWGSENLYNVAVPLHEVGHFRYSSSFGWYVLEILFVGDALDGSRSWVPNSLEEYRLLVLQDGHLVVERVDFFVSGGQPVREQPPPPPLAQLRGGISTSETVCKTGLVLMEKDQKPYCVIPHSVRELEERGWGIPVREPDPGPCGRYVFDDMSPLTVASLDHIITNGKLESFCVDNKNLWYVIRLDGVSGAGSLTVTIPKDEFDPRQFDYSACNPRDVSSYRVDVLVRQASQTETTRTLEFTWDQPIDHISYRKGSTNTPSHSEPTSCMRLYDIGMVGVGLGFGPERSGPSCIEKEGHFITNGVVLDACLNEDLYELAVSLDGVGSDAVLTVDVPYTPFFPLVTAENKRYFSVSGDNGDPQLDVSYQCDDYQTLEISLPAGTGEISVRGPDFTYRARFSNVGLDHEYNLAIPMLELDGSCIRDVQ